MNDERLEGIAGAVTRPDGMVEVHWPTGHVSGPFSPEEWAEMVGEARTPG